MDYLKYKGYLGSIEYSEEDGVYFGRVFGLSNSLVSYEGKTVEELEDDFKKVIDDYLQNFSDVNLIEKQDKRLFN